MKRETVEQVGDLAESHFENGLLCAESVVQSLANLQGLDNQHIPQIATAFCSGMARTCGTCGALTGAMMGVSLSLGRSDKAQSVQPVYEATQKLISEFENEFGAKDCHLLLGCDIGTEEGQTTFKENELMQQCKQYTRRASEIAADIIIESSAE